MEKNGQAFMQRLLATFGVEAGEHVQSLSRGLIELEQAAPEARAARVETAFREAHSLKGAARAVGKREIEALCQALESVFSALKRREIEVSPPLLDLLHAGLDQLAALLAALAGEVAPELAQAAAEAGRQLAAAGEGRAERPGAVPQIPKERERPAPLPEGPKKTERPGAPPAGPQEAEAPPLEAPPQAPPAAAAHPAPPAADKLPAAETVRVPVARLDALLFQGEALLAAKLAARQRAAELQAAHAAIAAWRRERARLLPEMRKLQRGLSHAAAAGGAGSRHYDGELAKIMDSLAGDEAALHALDGRLHELCRSAGRDERHLSGRVDGLLEELKEILMLPIAMAVEILPKAVRDLARSQGKEVDFAAYGDALEIDRRVLDKLRDPLLHLVRNSVDHGIETPERRAAAGKARRGRIELAARQVEGGRLEIRIADDGRGIDVEHLRAAAGRLGLLPAGGEAAAENLLSLVFQSGVSTSPTVTDISGRGLGLAIVREKIERLGGTVEVESQPGAGTAFRLLLPVTLATFRGVLVRAGGEEFVFPTQGLAQARRWPRADVKTVANRETLAIDGQALPLVRLAEILELAGSAADDSGPLALVLAGEGERRVAFAVDEVLGEQEVLVKGLGPQLARVRNIGGAALLGSGRVVPILYLPDLLQSARRVRRSASASASAPAPAPAPAPAAPPALLLAEDSITSRLLLKGILEAAGYRVATAVDGLEAYARLCTEPFAALVSDVEMPHLDGFALTERIRGDPRLAGLPVVLVTVLASPEDRARGAHAGANAYIVKGSFDQSDLLAALRRLL